MAEYESLDEIERAFNKLIKVAQQEDDNDRVAELRTELRERKADFREQQIREREIEAIKRLALAQFPVPKEYQDLVVGATEEQIMARAKDLSTRFQPPAPPPPSPQEQARAAYGTPAAVGGGQPAQSPRDPNTEFLENYARKYNNGEQLTMRETERFERLRGGRRIAEAIGASGKRWTENDLPWLKPGG
jgi:hypothetical protein